MATRLNLNQVLYKPLANSNTFDETNLEIDGDEDELEVISASNDDPNATGNDSHIKNAQSHRTANNWRYFPKQHGRNPVGLRQLRTILLATASVLLIIFILKLSTYKDHSFPEDLSANLTHSNAEIFTKAHNTSAGESLHNDHYNQVSRIKLVPASSRVVGAVANALISDPVESSAKNQMPKYDNYLSSIIYERDHKSDNKYMSDLLDDFRYSIGDERLSATSNAGNKWWLIGIRNERHLTISNYIRAMKSFNYNSSVTFVTQLVLESQSFHHTLELCERWDGPISVSLFLSRGLNELPVAISLIKFVRLCLPAPLGACMRDKVTWHLVFTPPKPDTNSLENSLSYPQYHLDTINYSSFANTDQCPKFAVSSTSELIRLFQMDILSKNNKNLISLADGVASEAETPVNVLRNVARSGAKTKYVLVADVDLYPSVNLASNFIELINSERMNSLDFHGNATDIERCIFLLPAFEMRRSNESDSQQPMPKTKRELVERIKNGQVWPYQEPNCTWCQDYPRRQEWLNSVSNQNDTLTVFQAAPWSRSGVKGWSPFFLAHNSYGDYNENLMSNERIDMMYEMCLLDYVVVVLDNAFLVRLVDPRNDSESLLTNDHHEQQGGQSVEIALSRLANKYKDNANIKRC